MNPLSFINGTTQPFAVLGHPISHSLSPAMHNAAFRALGWNAVYLAFDVLPEHLIPVLRAMQRMGFRGVNLTIPLKEVAFRGVDRTDESARLTGSVNTIRFDGETLEGHSTDGYGFLRAFREAFGVPIRGLSVCIAGAGGAGRALALTCAGEGISKLTLWDVDTGRAVRVGAEVRARAPQLPVFIAESPQQAATFAREADLIIQATPLGLKAEDPLPMPAESFRAGQWVFDLIYCPAETITMRAARAAGARAVNGLDMLLYQGVRAFEIWTGVEPPVEAMRAALLAAVGHSA